MIFNVLRDSQIDSLIESNIDCTGCSGKCCQVYEVIEITSKEAQSLEHDISIYDGRFFLKRKAGWHFSSGRGKPSFPLRGGAGSGPSFWFWFEISEEREPERL